MISADSFSDFAYSLDTHNDLLIFIANFLDTNVLREEQIFIFWASGFAVGIIIVSAFWIIHIFKAASDFDRD